jgi:hypothetical protein
LAEKSQVLKQILDIRRLYIYTLIVDFYASGVAPSASRFCLCLKHHTATPNARRNEKETGMLRSLTR